MAKKKRTFRNQYTYSQTAQSFETRSKHPSMTIPGESYTIPELIRRHTNGISENNAHIPIYQNEDASHTDYDLEKVQRLDAVDKNQLTIENQIALDELKKKFDERAQAASSGKDEQSESESQSDDTQNQNNTEAL